MFRNIYFVIVVVICFKQLKVCYVPPSILEPIETKSQLMNADNRKRPSRKCIHVPKSEKILFGETQSKLHSNVFTFDDSNTIYTKVGKVEAPAAVEVSEPASASSNKTTIKTTIETMSKKTVRSSTSTIKTFESKKLEFKSIETDAFELKSLDAKIVNEKTEINYSTVKGDLKLNNSLPNLDQIDTIVDQATLSTQLDKTRKFFYHF